MRLPSAPINPTRIDFSSTNVGTSFVQLLSATSAEIVMAEFYNSTSTSIILGVGPSGGEVTTMYILPTPGNGKVPLHIGKNSRLAIKTTSGTLSSGEFLMNLYV